MKKVILYLSPIMVGLLGGAFFEFLIYSVILTTLPLIDDKSLHLFLNLCVIISFVLFLFIAFLVIIDSATLINLNSKKFKWIILAQVVVVFLFFMISWSVFNHLVGNWYDAYCYYYREPHPTPI